MSRVPHPRFTAALAALLLLVPAPLAAQKAPPPAAPAPPYADLADLTVKAPMVIVATIHDAARIKGPEAANVAPGFTRYYLTVDVVALVRAPAATPAQIGYVFDVPLDPEGRAPKLKKSRVLLYARPIPNMPGRVQPVGPRAQIAWSPAAEATARSLAAAFVAPDAPPAITGIANAFHAAGTLPGEGETQIFLKTTGHPISLSVQRKQGQSPVWSVSLSEVVEDALPAPKRDTFLWYRLACGLPRTIPASLFDGVAPEDAAAVRADYALILGGLGPCRISAGGGPG